MARATRPSTIPCIVVSVLTVMTALVALSCMGGGAAVRHASHRAATPQAAGPGNRAGQPRVHRSAREVPAPPVSLSQSSLVAALSPGAKACRGPMHSVAYPLSTVTAEQAMALLDAGEPARAFVWFAPRRRATREDERYLRACAGYQTGRLEDIVPETVALYQDGACGWPGWLGTDELLRGCQVAARTTPWACDAGRQGGRSAYRLLVHSDGPGVRRAAEASADAMKAAMQAGFPKGARLQAGVLPIPVYIASDRGSADALLQQLTGTHMAQARARCLGLAIVTYDEACDTSHAEAASILAHETMHALQAAYGCSWMPTWLSEGSAVMAGSVADPAEGEKRLERARQAVAMHPGCLRAAMGQADGEPRDDYGLYYAGVLYVSETYGQQALYDIMNWLGPMDSPSQDQVLYSRLGMNSSQLADAAAAWLLTSGTPETTR